MSGESQVKLDSKGLNVSFRYRNTLPLANALAGPVFEKIDLDNFVKGRHHFTNIRTPSLESQYRWQPTHDPFAGMRPNLVDQDSMLRAEAGTTLEPQDQKLIYSNKKSSTTANNGARELTADQRPFWLRNTTYLESNPFNRAQNTNEDEAIQRSREQRKDKIERDPLHPDSIDASFREVTETIEKLKKSSKRKLSAVFPVLPGDPVAKKVPKMFTLLRFDEDISSLHPLELQEQTSHHSFQSEKSIVMNIREPEAVESRKAGVFHSTLVAPMAKTDEEPAESDVVEAGEEYRWLRDYRMEIQQTNLDDSFVLIVHPAEATATYLPVQARAEMKKLALDASQPHDTRVLRS